MPSTELQRAISQCQGGDFEQAESLLSRILEDNSKDAEANYQMARVLDLQGREREAIPYYSRAIDSGIYGEERNNSLLGLGSSHRTLGEYVKAVEVLRQGVAEFPEDRAMQVFLAIALYNVEEHQESVRLLLRNLIETTSDAEIRSYEEALDFYSNRLDEIWR